MSGSFAESMEMLAFRLHVYDDLHDRTQPDTTGWVDVVGTAKADINSDFATGMAASYEADREAVAVVLAQGNISTGLDSFMEDVAQQTGSVAGTGSEQFRDLFDYMHTSGEFIKSRQFVMGDPLAAGGNTGDGEISRCVIDDRGYTMEGWFADSFTAECTSDSNQLGVQFEELFQVKGQNSSIDNLKRSGSGLDVEIAAWSENDTETFVTNPGFEEFAGNTPTAGNPETPTTLAGWTPASGGFTNLQVQVDQLWRTPPGSTKSFSVEFTDNETLSQALVAINGTEIDQNFPHRVGIALYRKSSCDGQFLLKLGQITRHIVLSSLNNNAWTWIWLRATADKYNWYENFKTNDLTLSYQLISRTTGSIVLDGGLMGPMVLIGGAEGVGRGAMGTFIFARSGQTPFVGGAGGLTGDSFTWADSETGSVNQRWLAEGDVGYLPSTSAGYEQTADK